MKQLLSLLAVFILTGAFPVIADQATIERVSVTDGITFYRVSTAMGNTTSVVYGGQEGVLLIDPNFNGSADLLKQAIAVDHSSKITYLTSSHEHRDHIEQYSEFSELVTIIVPQSQASAVAEWGGVVDVTYTDALTLYLDNNPIKLMTMPETIGHTSGDQIIHFVADKVLYVGDYYFARGYPIIDLNMGDLYGYINNITYITENFPDDTVIIPGHTTFAPEPMQLATIAQLKQFAHDLKQTAAIVKDKVQQGDSLETIQQQGLPEQFSIYDVSPSFKNEKRWIEYLYKYFKHQM